MSAIVSAKEILKELELLGSERYKNTLRNHGIKEPFFGVKISELQKIRKRIKKNHQLAIALYESGNYDAMYLAGLIADDQRMTKKDLQRWVANAYCGALSNSTVAWVAAKSTHGYELARKWIESKQERVAAAGWSTLCGLVVIKDDSQLDLGELKTLLLRVQKTIHDQPNAVRHTMNQFVIAIGSYVRAMSDDALLTAAKIGDVIVDMGGTACKVPAATEHINKAKQRGALGKKRKTIKC